jgi:LPS export ABC transporter permease LptG
MILGRMLFSLHAKTFLATLAVLLLLSVVMEFFESAHALLSGKGGAGDILLFCLCRVPDQFVLLAPIAFVAASCVTFARLSQGNELRAVAAAGIGPARMALPVFITAVLAVATTILTAEFVVPQALDRLDGLMQTKFGRIDSSWRYYHVRHWYKGEAGRIFHVIGRSGDLSEIKLLELFEVDGDFHVSRRTRVHQAAWKSDHWEGKIVETWLFSGATVSAYSRDSLKKLDWPERPERFKNLHGRPNQKTLAELSRVIDEMQARGVPNAPYRLELHNRFARPVLGVCLIFFFFPWLSAPGRRRTLAGALSESIVLVFAAYFVVALCTVAVGGGLIAASTGAWIPPLLFLIAAVPGWLRAEK